MTAVKDWIFARGRTMLMLLAALLTPCGNTVAIAQGAAQQTGGWQYEFTPYFWGSGMKGHVQGGSLPNITVDASFSDILDVLDFGLMGAFEARKDRWVVLLDAIYMKLSAGGAASRTGPGPIGATASANANLGIKQTVLAAAAAYRALEGRNPVDVIGGLRYNKLEADADIHGSFFAQAGSVAGSADKDWVDPYIGARIQHPLAERWTLVGYGDVGGFGVGSDFSWQVSAGVNYDFAKNISGKFGYRAFYVDYNKSDFLYDMKNEGLFAGVGIRF